MFSALTVTVKDQDETDLLTVSIIYSGSGTSLTIDIDGTRSELADAILDTKARIVHLHVICSEVDFKVQSKLSKFVI